MGVLTFKASGEWVEGLRIDTRVRNFSLSFDEPPSLGGRIRRPILLKASLLRSSGVWAL
jgi:hypothetical protein